MWLAFVLILKRACQWISLWISNIDLQLTRPMSKLENSAPDTALGSLNLTPTPRGGCIYSSQSNVYLTWTLKLIYSAAIWKQVSTLFKSPHCTVLNIFIIFTENISFCSLFNFCWRTPWARCAQLSSHHERTWYLSQNEEPLIRRGHRPKYF